MLPSHRKHRTGKQHRSQCSTPPSIDLFGLLRCRCGSNRRHLKSTHALPQVSNVPSMRTRPCHCHSGKELHSRTCQQMNLRLHTCFTLICNMLKKHQGNQGNRGTTFLANSVGTIARSVGGGGGRANANTNASANVNKHTRTRTRTRAHAHSLTN